MAHLGTQVHFCKLESGRPELDHELEIVGNENSDCDRNPQWEAPRPGIRRRLK